MGHKILFSLAIFLLILFAGAAVPAASPEAPEPPAILQGVWVASASVKPPLTLKIVQFGALYPTPAGAVYPCSGEIDCAVLPGGKLAIVEENISNDNFIIIKPLR